nr:unnamed protein product [Spirometra erinaceieuropaei]
MNPTDQPSSAPSIVATAAFHFNLADLEEQIQHRYDTLPPEPSADLVTGRLAASCKRGLASLQRSHAALEKDLVYLSERVTQFSRVADHLYPVYAGERQLQLLTRRNAVLEAWRGLASVADQRGRSLLDCYNLHRFIATARDLLEWMEEKKEEMSHPSTLRYATLTVIYQHEITQVSLRLVDI